MAKKKRNKKDELVKRNKSAAPAIPGQSPIPVLTIDSLK